MELASSVHVIRRRDLTAGVAHRWQDPEAVCELTPEKRAALLENPLSRDDSDPVQLIATYENVAAGKLDLFTGRIHLGNEVVPTIWSSGYFVPERFRNSLVAVMLLLKLHGINPTVGACGVSQLALPVIRKLKWIELPLPRYLVILRSHAIFERYVGKNLLTGVSSRLTDAVLLGQRTIWEALLGRRLHPLRTEAVARMPPELDEQLSSDWNKGQATPHRSAAWLDWLLTHSFGAEDRLRSGLFLVRGPDEAVVGYFLVKTRFYPVASHRSIPDVTLGSLQDWMIFDDTQLSLPHLVLLAVQELARWSPDAVELCLPEGEMDRHLRRWGFPRAGELRLILRTSRDSPLHHERFRHAEHWRLRPAEGDNFFS